MGLFDWILKGIGFEGSDKPAKTESSKKNGFKKSKEQVADKNDDSSLSASFSFAKNKGVENLIKEESESQKKDAIENGPETFQKNNIAVFSPVCNKDLEGIIDFTRKRLPAIVNLGGFDKTGMEYAVAFLNGAMFAMRGQIEKLDGNLILIAPENSIVNR
ncbi:MAG: cell division protein SepF [Clostridia bacterium]